MQKKLIVMISILSILIINCTILQGSEIDEITKGITPQENGGSYYVLDDEELNKLSQKNSSMIPHYSSNVRIEDYYHAGGMYGQLPYYTVGSNIIFCIQPSSIVSSQGVSTGESGSYWYGLNPAEKYEIGEVISYGMEYYNDTGNKDYLFATQVLVWEAVEPNNTSTGTKTAISPEIDKIHNKQVNHLVRPSFMGTTKNNAPTQTLTWDGSEYSITLKDKNGVWDDKFSSYGTYGNYKISNPSGSNNVKISTTNDYASNYSYQTTFHPYDNYNVKFYDAGQDLVSTYADPVPAYMNIKIKPAKGKGSLTKVNQNDEAIEDITFNIYDKDTNKKVDTITTNSSGYAKTKDLLIGDYYAKEVINNNNQVVERNEKFYFEIKPNTMTTIKDKNGDITIENIEYGDVYIEYIAAEMSEDTIKIRINNDDDLIIPNENMTLKIYNNDKLIIEDEIDLSKELGIDLTYEIPVDNSKDNNISAELVNKNGTLYGESQTEVTRYLPSQEEVEFVCNDKVEVDTPIGQEVEQNKNGVATVKDYFEKFETKGFKCDQTVNDGLANITGEVIYSNELQDLGYDNENRYGDITGNLYMPLDDKTFEFEKETQGRYPDNYRIDLKLADEQKVLLDNFVIEAGAGRVYRTYDEKYIHEGENHAEFEEGYRDGLEEMIYMAEDYPLPVGITEDIQNKTYEYHEVFETVGYNKINVDVFNTLYFHKKLISVHPELAMYSPQMVPVDNVARDEEKYTSELKVEVGQGSLDDLQSEIIQWDNIYLGDVDYLEEKYDITFEYNN